MNPTPSQPMPEPPEGSKCLTCDGWGFIPFTRGQTPESFEQGEYPCPDCATRTAPAGERKWHGPECTCADEWNETFHSPACAISISKGGEELSVSQGQATAPVEADKDAEIAPIEKAAELCGWERVPAAGPNVWHLKGTGFTITNDLPYSLRDQLKDKDADLTTARATIAEQAKRITELVGALQFYADISNFHVTVWEDETKDGKCWLEPASEHSLQEEKDGSSDFGIRALDALAHAAEGKEQA